MPENTPKKLKSRLLEIFEKNWTVTVEEYARKLYDNTASHNIEKTLTQSIYEELTATAFSSNQASDIINQLEANPVLQTSHHITPTNGPTFLAIDIISLCGLINNSYYICGANSGVAFSNTAWSGALSYGSLPLSDLFEEDSSLYRQNLKSGRERKLHGEQELRISLIPSRLRDQMLFGQRLTEFQNKLFRQFKQPLKDLLLGNQRETIYSRWAIRVCAQIQSQVAGLLAVV
jgi:hypothetical protein